MKYTGITIKHFITQKQVSSPDAYEDTAEKLDYLRMAKVVQGIHAVVQNY